MKNLRLVQHKSTAYTLIEFLIFVTLFSFIFVLFLGVLNREWFKLLKIGVRQNLELNLALASDVLRRDLFCASPLSSDWREADFIIKKQSINSSNVLEDEWVRWYVSENSLLRAVGRFSLVTGVWQSNDISLICSNIKQISVVLEKNEKHGVVTGVVVNLIANRVTADGNELQPRQFYVELRNRILK